MRIIICPNPLKNFRLAANLQTSLPQPDSQTINVINLRLVLLPFTQAKNNSKLKLSGMIFFSIDGNKFCRQIVLLFFYLIVNNQTCFAQRSNVESLPKYDKQKFDEGEGRLGLRMRR